MNITQYACALLVGLMPSLGMACRSSRPPCDHAVLKSEVSRLRTNFLEHDFPSEAAFDAVAKACSPNVPNVRFGSFYTPVVPSDPPKFLALEPSAEKKEIRRKAIANACDISEVEAEKLVNAELGRVYDISGSKEGELANAESTKTYEDRVYKVCKLSRINAFPVEEVRRYSQYWPNLAIMLALHKAGQLDTSDGRFLMRTLFFYLDRRRAYRGSDLSLHTTSNRHSSVQTHAGTYKIRLTRRAILLSGESIVDIRSGQIDATQKRGGQDSFYLRQFFMKLHEEVAKSKQIARVTEKPYQGVADMYVDRSLPSRVFFEAVYTAHQAQINDFRVILDEDPALDRPPGIPFTAISLGSPSFPSSMAEHVPVAINLSSHGVVITVDGKILPPVQACSYAPKATICHTLDPESFTAKVEEVQTLRDKYDDTKDLTFLKQSHALLRTIALDQTRFNQALESVAKQIAGRDIVLNIDYKIPFALTAQTLDIVRSKIPESTVRFGL